MIKVLKSYKEDLISYYRHLYHFCNISTRQNFKFFMTMVEVKRDLIRWVDICRSMGRCKIDDGYLMQKSKPWKWRKTAFGHFNNKKPLFDTIFIDIQGKKMLREPSKSRRKEEKIHFYVNYFFKQTSRKCSLNFHTTTTQLLSQCKTIFFHLFDLINSPVQSRSFSVSMNDEEITTKTNVSLYCLLITSVVTNDRLGCKGEVLLCCTILKQAKNHTPLSPKLRTEGSEISFVSFD